ncbi:hypothetical protein CAI21_15045, partial [Alkalilimnicola ehrlichii]
QRTEPIRLVRRELGPDEDEPMQGADVAMLEEMLWQLGLSPQQGPNEQNPYSGQIGARIASNRAGLPDGPVTTETCQGEPADRRDAYYSGWFAQCSVGRVSMEGMVRRFQARNFSDGRVLLRHLRDDASGVVDESTLNWLGRDWSLYQRAYEAYADIGSGAGVLGPDVPQFADWLADAVTVWEEGYEGVSSVPETYTQAHHRDVLEAAGLGANSYAAYSRQRLLRGWITHESSFHWGSNRGGSGGRPYQPTPYRMTEGGADEHGSLSFSQLLYAFRFGSSPCRAHGEAELNLYDPRENVMTFALHTGSDNSSAEEMSNCHGAFHRAFVSRGHPQVYRQDRGAVAGTEQHLDDLVGFRHGGGAIVPIDEATEVDAYDTFALGVAAYNGGLGMFARSWPRWLKYWRFDRNAVRNSNSTMVCFSCRYSIEVRNFEHYLNLPYREYIWAGEIYNDNEVREALIEAFEVELQAAFGEEGAGTRPLEELQTWVMEHEDLGEEAFAERGVPDVGEPKWCFAYGEREWRDPERTEEGGLATFEDYRNFALADGERRVPCED